MKKSFTDYLEAAREAREWATKCNLDVALRKVREFGQTRFNLNFASRNDSDYAMAEIIRPGESL